MKRTIVIMFVIIMSIAHCLALDIVLRYDDFRLQEDSLQDEMIEMFAEEHIPLHIAIIPYHQDTTPILQNCQSFEHVKELQRHGILKIALHGFCHKGETFQGEFLSLNEQEQRFRLEMGSKLLDSIFGEHVHIFIPPWNRYNQITLDILSDLGYNIISSELTDNQLMSDERFQYYQEGCDHPAKLQQIVVRNAKREGLVVCMFHRYDFTDSFTMEDLKDVLREIKANPQTHIVTMDELYQRDQSFNETRIKANLHHPLLTKLLQTRPIILTVREANILRIIDLLLHLLIVVIISLIGAWILKCSSQLYWIVQSLVCLFAALQTWFQFVMPKIGLALIIILSISIVFYNAIRKLKHQ